VAIATVILQLFILSFFIESSDFNAITSDWQYSLDCPRNSLECENRKRVTPLAWLAFSCIILCYLSKDMIEGVTMVYQSFILKSVKGVLAGFVVIFITMTSAVASVLYNYSTGISNTDVLKDAVILLFLNDIDEQLYTLLSVVAPSFVEKRNDSVSRHWSGRLLSLKNSLRESMRTMRSTLMSTRRLSFMHATEENFSKDVELQTNKDEKNHSILLDLQKNDGNEKWGDKMNQEHQSKKENEEFHANVNPELQSKNEMHVGESYITKLEKEINNLHLEQISMKSKYKKEISMNKKEISTHKTEISNLTSKLVAMEKKHSALEDEIDDLKKILKSFVQNRENEC